MVDMSICCLCIAAGTEMSLVEIWCRVVWCGAVRCGAVRCGAVQCSAVQCSAVHHHTQHNTTAVQKLSEMCLRYYYKASTVNRSYD